MEIKIIPHKTGYKIEHYPKGNKIADMLNRHSKGFVFTKEGAEKIKRSLENKY